MSRLRARSGVEQACPPERRGMSRFLADENFPGGGVVQLRSSGYDVDRGRQSHPGNDDETVLQLAEPHRICCRPLQRLA